jgi:hypothetical protein
MWTSDTGIDGQTPVDLDVCPDLLGAGASALGCRVLLDAVAHFQTSILFMAPVVPELELEWHPVAFSENMRLSVTCRIFSLLQPPALT